MIGSEAVDSVASKDKRDRFQAFRSILSERGSTIIVGHRDRPKENPAGREYRDSVALSIVGERGFVHEYGLPSVPFFDELFEHLLESQYRYHCPLVPGATRSLGYAGATRVALKVASARAGRGEVSGVSGEFSRP